VRTLKRVEKEIDAAYGRRHVPLPAQSEVIGVLNEVADLGM